MSIMLQGILNSMKKITWIPCICLSNEYSTVVSQMNTVQLSLRLIPYSYLSDEYRTVISQMNTVQLSLKLKPYSYLSNKYRTVISQMYTVQLSLKWMPYSCLWSLIGIMGNFVLDTNLHIYFNERAKKSNKINRHFQDFSCYILDIFDSSNIF